MSAAGELLAAFDELPLIDHHVHGVVRTDVDRTGLESLISESHFPTPPGVSGFDTPVGFAVRRHCAPVLGLPRHASAEDYVARRRELGAAEVNRRLLSASGVERLLVDTGHRAAEITDLAETAAVAGQQVDEVVRLEPVAEQVAAEGVDAARFAAAVAERLAKRAAGAVGLKTVIAYRHGLDFDPAPPSHAEVTAAAGRWLAAGEPGRLTDHVLLRAVLWTGVELGLPLQFHVGYGDPDLRLHRCNPLLMTEFIEAVQPRGVPVMLLHCYPYHREAGFLAQMYPHVYFDVGEAVNYTGARSTAVLAESLELAPFGKALFSSDGWGAAELHHLGAVLWRRGMASVLGGFVESGEWSADDAVRVATLIGRDNARRVYDRD
jgi:predicted TIM-barrel fold metal-dependent hydrolase